MITRFKTLFTVAIPHGYYGGLCGDFEFLVPADARQVLNNLKLLGKAREGKLFVLYEAAEDGTPLLAAAGSKVRFGLKLMNTGFCNFTALNFSPGTAAMLWENKTVPDKLNAPRQMPFVGDQLTQSLAGAERPVNVALLDAAGNSLRRMTTTEQEKRTAASFDLSSLAAGAISVEETYPTDPTKSTAYYHDPELLQEAAFGVVEVRIGAGFYAAAPAFEIPFAAREETLKYYIVANNYPEAEFNQLTVSDKGFDDEKRSEIKFDKVASADFSKNEIPVSLLANSDSKVVLFKSKEAVARREKARRKIQLNRNGKPLIEHLPQPAADSATADIIIHVAKSKP